MNLMVRARQSVRKSLDRESNNPKNKAVQRLFIFFSIYLVLPLVDIPLFGFSLSAVLILLIFLIYTKDNRLAFSKYTTWVWLALFIGLGTAISFFVNGLQSGGTAIEGASIVVHYFYWLFLFVFVVYLFAENIVPISKAIQVIGIAVFILALLRLFEAAAWGKIGAWTSTRIMTQNSYGFMFSMFVPTNYYLILEKKGKDKFFALLRFCVILLAVLINGSRGSWIALGISLGCFILITIISFRSIRQVFSLFGTVTLILLSYVLFVTYMPLKVVSAFESRFLTLNSLDTDKSYGVRKVLNQKGLVLFSESPIVGVGPARFNKEFRELEIPYYLSYNAQEQFNIKTAHNSYVAFLAEEGLLASIPFAILIISLFIRGGFSTIRCIKDGEYWGLGVYLCFISMSVHMWGINTLTNTANWFVYASVAALIEYTRQKQAHNSERQEWVSV